MKFTFLDTSFLVAIANPADSLHERAVTWKLSVSGNFITTDFILMELANGLAAPHLRTGAAAIIDSLRRGPATEIIRASADLVDRGLTLFHERPDKPWSLTDCISFNVMSDRGITDALTHDRHFEQAGFKALLRSDPPNN